MKSYGGGRADLAAFIAMFGDKLKSGDSDVEVRMVCASEAVISAVVRLELNSVKSECCSIITTALIYICIYVVF